MSLDEQVIDTIHCAGTALEAAEHFHATKTAEAEKAAAEVSPAIEACIKSGLIETNEREDLRRVLQDHAQTLQFLAKVAEHHGRSVPTLGQPVANGHAGNGTTWRKNAGHNGMPPVPGSLNSPFVGVRTPALKDSDRALFEGLGLPLPQDDCP